MCCEADFIGSRQLRYSLEHEYVELHKVLYVLHNKKRKVVALLLSEIFSPGHCIISRFESDQVILILQHKFVITESSRCYREKN